MKSANTNLCALESGGGMSAVMVKTWQRTFCFFLARIFWDIKNLAIYTCHLNSGIGRCSNKVYI